MRRHHSLICTLNVSAEMSAVTWPIGSKTKVWLIIAGANHWGYWRNFINITIIISISSHFEVDHNEPTFIRTLLRSIKCFCRSAFIMPWQPVEFTFVWLLYYYNVLVYWSFQTPQLPRHSFRLLLPSCHSCVH